MLFQSLNLKSEVSKALKLRGPKALEPKLKMCLARANLSESQYMPFASPSFCLEQIVHSIKPCCGGLESGLFKSSTTGLIKLVRRC